jgi:hypothetical protein
LKAADSLTFDMAVASRDRRRMLAPPPSAAAVGMNERVTYCCGVATTVVGKRKQKMAVSEKYPGAIGRRYKRIAFIEVRL